MQKQRRRNRKLFFTPFSLLIIKSSYALRITLILCTFACTLSEVCSNIVSDGLILSSGNNNSNFESDNEIVESNSTDNYNSSSIIANTTDSISTSSSNNDSIIISSNSNSNLSVISEQNQNDSRKIVLCGQRLYYVINMVCSFNHMPFSNDQLFNSQISNETNQSRYPRSEPVAGRTESSNSTNNYSTNLTSQSNSSESSVSGSYEESNEIFPRLSRRTRGVIDECCRNPERGCTKNELTKYCSKPRSTTTTPPPILSNSINSELDDNNVIGPDSSTSSQTMVNNSPSTTTTTETPGNEIFFFTVPTIRNVVANDN